ncbi:hypothetical protein HZU40_14495 [Mycolicibacterium fluoranthenivorans]|jgi:hypothetical protein|uniref:SPW repeat-containing protein n=1 Tax=Mycolicibacterium fluoranthenivorans TaxID=258505 RepID=A0A1G4VRQ4_9MYCO|nr:hypothetical protein [Mycolicibacterium fluoranthenivorans]QNJ95324.1 hypothetical protein HZU40_14495 [Mycolicibacterium fluoranthenivorans]SCX10909.1 hypothetical protein SAMN02799620_01475 [Mycolicibacterium fluoranthenivorans]
MPKLIVVVNLLFLLCFSVLAGASVPALLDAGPAVPRHVVAAVTVTGAVTGTVMLLTEIFSGIRWAPVVALASLATGWFVMGDDAAAPTGSAVAWLIGWCAVATWFGYLAFQGREDR